MHVDERRGLAVEAEALLGGRFTEKALATRYVGRRRVVGRGFKSVDAIILGLGSRGEGLA
jgi:hypothetical protein